MHSLSRGGCIPLSLLLFRRWGVMQFVKTRSSDAKLDVVAVVFL